MLTKEENERSCWIATRPRLRQWLLLFVVRSPGNFLTLTLCTSCAPSTARFCFGAPCRMYSCAEEARLQIYGDISNANNRRFYMD